MLKFLKKCVIVCLVVFFSTGCSTNLTKSYTFKVETGDSVKVTLDISDKDNLKQKDGQFSIEKNKKVLSQGVFINKSTYEQYVSMLLDNSDVNLSVIDNGKTDDYTYFFYEYKGESGVEHDYVIWLKGSSTGILMGSLKNKKVAQSVFEKLTFEIVDE
ncbi:MAG: hypothetical protein Q4Q31_12420 [Bacillota bacterium]|nr:hypothetical protein [Bacillota bacterium]